MKIGDYVRTENGLIGKIIGFKGDMVETDNKRLITYKSNHSECEIKERPIDLIEVGDILVIKDFVDEACMIFTDIYLIQNEQQLLNIKNDLEKNKNKMLYSIVTKEVFESMEYKIGDE